MKDLQAYLESKPKGHEIRDWPTELPAPEGWELLHYADYEGTVSAHSHSAAVVKSLIRKL